MYGYSVSAGQRTFEVKVCADKVFYRPIPNHPQNGANLIAVTNNVETVVNGSGWVYWGTLEHGRGIEQLPNSECSDCSSSIKTYDCLNGACVESADYDTPGLFNSLADCEAACGSGTGCAAPNICVPPDYCPPGMVCLPAGEFSQIEGLGVALNNSACI
jgi:hypothetical protein